MELLPNFLEKAIDYMEKDKSIAAIAGIGKDIHIEKGKAVGCSENLYKRDTTQIAEVDYLAGVALFRRQAIEETGDFNPYLYSQEELELCQRLRKKGWKLLSLPYPMITHYSYSPKGIQTFRKQLAYNRFTGIGQIVRLSLRTSFFWSNLWKFKKFFFFLIVITIMVIATVVYLIKKNMVVLSLEGAAIAFFYLYLVIRKRSLKKAVITSIKWLCIVFSIVKGFLKIPKNPQSYPQEVKIIRRAI